MGQALGKQSLMDAIKSGGWKVVIDGNLGETMVARGPGGELVGTDEYGNKYFEQKDAILNRDRWVVFANSTHYTGQNPTVVSPEWHGWLHFITDDSPANATFAKPRYHLEAKMHPTMSADRYSPKGAWGTPRRRSWRKYEAWRPPSSS